MWEAINSAKTTADLRSALYFVCCRLQELETNMTAMKQIKVTKKQKAELKRIADFFLEATEPIEDTATRAMVSVKILSRLGCFTEQLVKK